MYSLSAVLTVASLFATSGLSATVPYTPKFVGPTYVLAQNMDWSAGVIYDGDGKVAVKTYERDNKIFFNNGTTSYITKPTSICDDNTGSVDSTGVDFNVRTHDQYIMYSWRFTRSDKSYFTWTPYSPSTEGRNTVAGLVVRQGESADGQRGISGRIFESQPDDFPKDLIKGDAFTIERETPEDNTDYPTGLEMIELVYLLSLRHQECPVEN